MSRTTFVAGATGATGRLLVRELLERGESVRTVVRSRVRLIDAIGAHERLEIVEASLLDLSDAQLAEHVAGCRAVASCLGHTLSLRGIYGAPRRLVRDAVRRLADAVRQRDQQVPVRFVLMSSAGVQNKNLAEPLSLAHRVLLGLIRTLVPPHADNESAADWLRLRIGADDPKLGWVVVRPDTLTNAAEVTDRTLHRSPTRSALFDPGKTSRANVARLMADLITEDALWDEWQGEMPVIYNAGD